MSRRVSMELGPGSEIAGYRVEALIGRGGMGAVYRAEEVGLGRKVALKVITQELASEGRFRERFLRESRIAASLEHPHVVPIHGAGEDEDVLFLAMRYVEGTDLATLLAAEGPLEPERALALLSQVAEALDAAHAKGLVHRDVKPSNVLIAQAAGSESCYLADFGLTKRTGSDSAISTPAAIVGTLEYIAPEQITGEPLDARADVYSLGCVLYECLTGQVPFPRATDVALLWAHVNEDPPPPSSVRPDLPADLDPVLARALAKDPRERFASAGELLEACSEPEVAAHPTRREVAATNLPRPLSSFVGREAELAEVRSLLQGGARLLTLTGPGGTGKTRLALEVARSLAATFENGVFWVGLASLRDPALVAGTIAQSVGARDDLAEHIGEQKMLILLDNLEQVIDAAPDLSRLLGRSPNLTLLVTSRELLRLQGEVEYPVPPLAEPEAVSLFCERSRLEPSGEIAELCARLDNLPLAVELAAARTKAMSPAQILERLSERLDLFKGSRDADPRQQTLRATIEWSYDLLSEEEQRLFRRLSVFAGGCTLEAAQEVCGAELDTLHALVEKSLLRFASERYWMLATVREYAAARLVTRGEMGAGLERLQRYLVELAKAQGAPWYLHRQEAAYKRLDTEHANARAVMEWALESGRHAPAVELVSLWGDVWLTQGHAREFGGWLESLQIARGLSRPLRASMLLHASQLWTIRGDLDRAAEAAEEFVELGELDPSIERFEVASALSDLSRIALERGDQVGARSYAERSLAFRDAHSLPRGGALAAFGLLALEEGDLGRAEELLLSYQEAAERSGNWWGRAYGRILLGDVAHRRGDLACATERYVAALRYGEALRAPAVVGDSLQGLALVASERGQPEQAGTLWGAGQALRETAGHPGAFFQRRREPELPAEAKASGAVLSLDEAVEYALGLTGDVDRPLQN